MSHTGPRPPLMIAPGPESTPPGGTDTGTPEQRIGAGIASTEGKVDTLISDVRRTEATVRQLDSTTSRMLDGYHEVLAIVSTLRARTETQDEQIGSMLGALARIEKRLGIVEHGPREGSSPALESLARVGARVAELHLEDEDTKVRERRDLAQRRAEARGLVLIWARRAAIVVGPILGAALYRACGG